MFNNKLLTHSIPGIKKWTNPVLSESIAPLWVSSSSASVSVSNSIFGTISCSSMAINDYKKYCSPARVFLSTAYDLLIQGPVNNALWTWKLPYEVMLTNGYILSSPTMVLSNYFIKYFKIYSSTTISDDTLLVPQTTLSTVNNTKTYFTVVNDKQVFSNVILVNLILPTGSKRSSYYVSQFHFEGYRK